MPWGTCNRLVQKKWGGKAVFLRELLALIGLVEGLWSVGTRFRPAATSDKNWVDKRESARRHILKTITVRRM